MAADDRTVVHGPDGTLLMPAPGGRALPRRQRPEPPAPVAKPNAEVDLQRLVAGVNPLLSAAHLLLALVAQLRNTSAHSDPAGLRAQLLGRVAEFEALARANGVPAPQVSAARYVLCSLLDEVIAATPWGAEGVWAARTLLQEFHDEKWGGDKAFELLERLSEDVAANGALLELFYVCLALGFEGRFRGQANGRAQLDAIAERLFRALHPEADASRGRPLSLRWQGVSTAHERRWSALPLWVAPALAAAAVIGLCLALSAQLDRLAQPVFRQILAAPLALQIDRSAAAAKPRLAPLLQADVASGALEVRDDALRSLLTLPADTLFVPGSAQLEPGRRELLGRIARALAAQPGPVVVIGHSDNQATSSLQFPTNWHLSRARAQSVMQLLAQQGLPSERLRAEGRADVEPRSPDSTPAGRALNRRIEIDLLLPRPDS